MAVGGGDALRAMAILPIRTFPDPVLSVRCQAVRQVDDALRDLADRMLETMYDAPGVGLAAPQVGRSCNLVVVDCTPQEERGQSPLVLINPRIVEYDGEIVFEEGCLSVPDYTADVRRAERVVVHALDRDGRPMEIRADGLLAVCLQHELDHLEGRLFLDRLSPLKRNLYKKRRMKQLRREGL